MGNLVLQSQIDQLRDAPTETLMMIIGGQHALSTSDKMIPIILSIDVQDKSLLSFDKFTNHKTVWI